MKLNLDELAISDKVISCTQFNSEQIALMVQGMQPGERILDLGVGFGNLAQALIEDHKHVYGVDYNPASLQYVLNKINNHNGRLSVGEVNVHNLPFNETFDGVTILSNMGEFTNPKYVIRGAYRALERGGLLGITGIIHEQIDAYTKHLETDIRLASKEKRLKLSIVEKGRLLKLYTKINAIPLGENPTTVIDLLQHAGFYIEDRENFYHNTCYFLLAGKP